MTEESKKTETALEKIKALEIENFIYKDKLETIKDSLSLEQNTEQELFDSLENIESTAMITNIAKLKQILKKYYECHKKANMELIDLNKDDLLTYSPRKIETNETKSTVVIKNKMHKLSHSKDSLRDRTRLLNWIHTNVPKSTHDYLRNYEGPKLN